MPVSVTLSSTAVSNRGLFGIVRNRVGRHGDGAFLGSVFDGVIEQVGQDLYQPVFIAEYRGQIAPPRRRRAGAPSCLLRA